MDAQQQQAAVAQQVAVPTSAGAEQHTDAIEADSAGNVGAGPSGHSGGAAAEHGALPPPPHMPAGQAAAGHGLLSGPLPYGFTPDALFPDYTDLAVPPPDARPPPDPAVYLQEKLEKLLAALSTSRSTCAYPFSWLTELRSGLACMLCML
jgi:hypothetical protein